MSTFNIAIVGAGVAGLTLARVLQVHGIRSTVFELDSSPRSRDQGGTLDLHLESGQAALHAAGLFSKFQTYIRSDGQEMRLVDRHAKVHVRVDSAENTVERPEIDRGALRQILVDSIDKETIQWDTRVKEIKPSQGDAKKYTIVYNGDREATYDLVVGADGAWSKVRKLLSDATPTYSGVTFVELRISEAQARHPQILELVGGGSCFIISDGKGVTAQVNADRTVRVYMSFHLAEDKFAEVNSILSSPVEARRYLLDMYDDWDEKIKDIVRFSDDVFILRPIHELPVPHVWESKPGLTLIGDAAHLMSPFAGEGANMAMWDGAELAEKVAEAAKTGKSLADTVSDFEQAMYTKTRPMVEMSANNLRRFMAPDGLEQVLHFFNTHMVREH